MKLQIVELPPTSSDAHPFVVVLSDLGRDDLPLVTADAAQVGLDAKFGARSVVAFANPVEVLPRA